MLLDKKASTSNNEYFGSRVYNAFRNAALSRWASLKVPVPETVVHMAQNIQVFLRYRNASDHALLRALCPSMEHPATNVYIPCVKETLAFDKVFRQNSSQESIFCEVAESMIEQTMNGFNCSIIACGQSGTGKRDSTDFLNCVI
ncbi:uncharacterized protein BYT42DRAFT_606270 [Radiomyces spectabilis]|uniref:uncharacterized protein n=1 Tax=Radiomyces spectabilis TaxID=64574 RepID=UPI00221EC52F|nr:uncharacterized protein BYT42DRAFT_606270 [Radiomyces spectabilis]KAI8374331.1 hypothetical protein BYT42DRAFT_606270 [Radiomyces spectabilis]